MRAATRSLIVAITIWAWIAVCNHCALRALTRTTTDASRSGCPFHSKPSKPAPNSAATQCCKTLRAVSMMQAKTLAPAIVDLVHANSAFPRLYVLTPPRLRFSTNTADTGPPGTTAFVELIGSVQSHAPPFFS